MRLPQATITENKDGLNALWSAGDEVFYRNLSRNEYIDPQEGSVELSGTLNADKDGSVASFSGNRVWCTASDQLALIYPALDPSDFTFHASPLRAEYTISVTGQDGSLATLAEKYHHIYGIASIVSVTETTANAELAQMKSLMTVCKFSFVDESNNQLPISSLEIGYYTNGTPNDGKYPQDGTVSIAHNTPVGSVHVEPNEETLTYPLTIDTKGANPKEVYVALFPKTEQPYKFTVTNSNGTYTGTATATLNEGEYVVAPLKLTKNN